MTYVRNQMIGTLSTHVLVVINSYGIRIVIRAMINN